MAEEIRKPVSAIFSVRTSDNSFDSSISIPLHGTEASKRAVIESWLALMGEALRHVGEAKEADHA